MAVLVSRSVSGGGTGSPHTVAPGADPSLCRRSSGVGIARRRHAVVVLGDFAARAALLAESLAIRRSLGDPVAVAARLDDLAIVRFELGGLGRARVLYDQSLAIKRAAGIDAGLRRAWATWRTSLSSRETTPRRGRRPRRAWRWPRHVATWTRRRRRRTAWRVWPWTRVTWTGRRRCMRSPCGGSPAVTTGTATPRASGCSDTWPSCAAT